ncbi:serine hydrolase domain-containing protein [Kribbella sp. NPDC059898]|uniref:serine hydrolase domain-containing protein n=1 Tax=Kribbella sp. NPDC059898 TaxID=3346995 RepID=UPI00364981AD
MLDWLQERLPELIAEHAVPGIAVGVWAGGEVYDAAAGVLNTATGVEATTDSIFQIGSVTKVLTATLAMQLVDERKVELDASVLRYLPTFGRDVTVRQLMCHVAGFEGDIFTDTGPGDDCIERYVDLLDDVPQLFAPGSMFSYNNAAFCVLGRVIEVVRGKQFDACMRDHLFEPLGMTHAANNPYEAILHRVAVGHLDGEPVQTWAMARSNAPAGSMLAMRARDLVRFARLQGQVLSAESAAAMQEPQITLPDIGWADAWGLGWELSELPGGTVIGHDGSTVGQAAFLRVVPERDVAIAILTNGGSARPVDRELMGRLLQDLAGVTFPELPVPDPGARPEHPERYVGRYTSRESITDVRRDADGRLWLEQTPIGVSAEIGDQPHRTELVAWRGDSLLPVEPSGGVHWPVAFVGRDNEGRAEYLHTGRADRRA